MRDAAPRLAGRHNSCVEAATGIPHRAASVAQPPGTVAPARTLTLPRALGALGLVGVVVSTFLVVAGAASGVSAFVPGSHRGSYPAWLAGPLRGIGVSHAKDSFQWFQIALCVSYGLVLVGVRELGARAIAATIVIAHVLLLLGPILLSLDAFGYVSFARLGALHGLDPYTSTSAAVPTDAVYRFVGWPHLHSPYGPLFTLGSYALVPLGVAGMVWALKSIAVLSSLGAIALVALAARRGGRSPASAAAFVGLNPVLLVVTVGGAHNDTLLLLLLAAALALSAGARWGRAAIALVTAVGVKVSAGLVLPFLVLGPRAPRDRLRTAVAALIGLAALAVLGLVGFGSHALRFVDALRGQQQMVTIHSVPNETARLIGAHGLPDWLRTLYVAGFVAVLLFTLWRTARGADWRAMAGWTTLALLLSTAWLLPWYVVWVLPLAALVPGWRLRAAALVMCAYAIMIHLPFTDPLLIGGPHHPF